MLFSALDQFLRAGNDKSKFMNATTTRFESLYFRGCRSTKENGTRQQGKLGSGAPEENMCFYSTVARKMPWRTEALLQIL